MEITADDIRDAAKQLARSERGYSALLGVEAFLEGFGTGLDTANQEAVLTLVCGAWGSYPTHTREAMREALVSPTGVHY